MDVWKIVITITIILICLAALYFIYQFRKKANVEEVIDEAVKRAEYQPTIFKIYDKSSKKVCNRLIVVSPFDWYIWACRGELYILNPEGGIKCAPNSTPAIQVLKDQFLETCLKLNMNSILDAYVNGKVPYTVPYEINSKTFTILSAINILVKDYITFDIEDHLYNNHDHVDGGGVESTTYMKQITSDVQKRFKRIRHLTDHDVLTENFEYSNDMDRINDENTYGFMGRSLTASSVVAKTTKQVPNISKLYEQYTKHTSKLQPTLESGEHHFTVYDLSQDHHSYITLRQHAIDSHENLPRMQLREPKIVEIAE